MPDVFSKIGSVFSSPAAGPAISGGVLGLGELGNLLAGRQQQNAYNAITKTTPEQIAADAARTAKPLDNALVQGVTNQVQGDLASRGLSQAPGIAAASESQALAPYVENNYTQALNTLMQKLGLNLNAAQLLPKGQNLTPAMMLFLKQLQQLKARNAAPPTTPPFMPQGTPPFMDPNIQLPDPNIAGAGSTADLSQLGVNPG